MKKLLSIAVLFMMTLQFNSCDDIDILSPPGPAGMSAYKEWVNAVKDGTIAWSSGTDLPNFFKFLKGDKGEAGTSSYASWVELIKTGTVENPHKPGSKWDPSKDAPSDFYSFLTGAKGDAGLTPHINAKGNWQIGTVDTGIPAKGQPGAPGLPGAAGSVVEINDAGNWEIDGADTGISAQGKDGVGGTDGKSAYEIWVTEVEAGNIKDKDGNLWPPGNITLIDFWEYLTGASAEPKVATLLSFVKSEVDPADKKYEVFHFESEAGAVVTMQYEKQKLTCTADASGECSIRFPNKASGFIPVLATAIKTGKAISENIMLSVKAQAAYFKLGDIAVFYAKDNETVHAEGNGSFLGAAYKIDEYPRVVYWKNLIVGSIEIAFESENIKNLAYLGGTRRGFVITTIWNADRKGGRIRFARPEINYENYAFPVPVDIYIESESGEVTFYPLGVNGD